MWQAHSATASAAVGVKLLLEQRLLRCEDAPADASSCFILSTVRWYPAQMRKVVVDRWRLVSLSGWPGNLTAAVKKSRRPGSTPMMTR